MEEFTDAQQMAIDNPDTFKAPELEELYENLWLGDYVKVSTSSERFWVKVSSVDGDYISGTVSNELIRSSYKFGDPITVQFKNVYAHESRGGLTIDDEEGNIVGTCPTCN